MSGRPTSRPRSGSFPPVPDRGDRPTEGGIASRDRREQLARDRSTSDPRCDRSSARPVLGLRSGRRPCVGILDTRQWREVRLVTAESSFTAELCPGTARGFTIAETRSTTRRPGTFPRIGVSGYAGAIQSGSAQSVSTSPTGGISMTEPNSSRARCRGIPVTTNGRLGISDSSGAACGVMTLLGRFSISI